MVNNSKATLPELLAPAGDWETLKVAVAAGADAVYAGGKMFSARQFATNFDRDELAAAAELVMNKLDNVPVAVIRGYDYPRGEGSLTQLIRAQERDLFR